MGLLRKLMPGTSTDALAMGFTLVMVPVAYLHGAININPIVFWSEDSCTSYYVSLGFMTFLLVNTLLNYYLLITIDTSCRRVILPVVGPPGWRYCPFCQHNAPPRSHHCPTCNQCVLRRDHHCYFAGKCIGYYNHRYFLAFLIYVATAAVYGVILSFWAVFLLVGGFTWTILPSLVFPVMAWLLQMMPVSPLIMVETSVAMFASLGAGGLLGLQLYQIYRGETLWEFRKGVGAYNRGFAGNMAEVMGKNWWFCWILPFIPSPLSGDGTQYQPLGGTVSQTTAQDGRTDTHTPRKQIKGL